MRKRNELNGDGCLSKAHGDEMIFVLLGRDLAAPVAIRAWVQERLLLGANEANDDQIVEALACADIMQQERQERMKKENR